MIDNVKVCEPFSSSEHNVITFDLLHDSRVTSWKDCYFDYKIGNYKEMDKSLQNDDWDALFSDNNTKEMWDIFKEVLDNTVSKFCSKEEKED